MFYWAAGWTTGVRISAWAVTFLFAAASILALGSYRMGSAGETAGTWIWLLTSI